MRVKTLEKEEKFSQTITRYTVYLESKKVIDKTTTVSTVTPICNTCNAYVLL